jgi:predicted nucleotidyltransferase
MFEQLLVKIAEVLDASGIRYMIIGGQAVLLYGEPRLTKDIDITLGVNLDRLDEVLELVGTLALQPLVEADSFTRQTLVLPCQDSQSGIRVDFIFSYSAYEQQALDRVRFVPMGKARVRFAAPEDVIIHKVIAGRPRDLEDVKSILLKQSDVDRAYVQHWLEDYASVLGQPLLPRFEQLWEETR